MLTLSINLPTEKYPIYIENGLLNNIGAEIKKIYKNKRIAIITDSNVQSLYADRLLKSLNKEGFITKLISIPPGEKSKSFEVLERTCEEILGFQLSRSDLILTFGGGVVGDLGGFAASILLRGISFIQIPTTLLAQIDSSVGGKVAINSSQGKNLIGSFYQPKAVFIDPELLKTLGNREFNDGLGEIIKYGAIKDKDLFDNLLNYNSKIDIFRDIEKIIYTCCNIKKQLVEKDEKDLGERMLLNFGHTIGHGIEKLLNYEGYTHGEAVAAGMCIITRNSEALGFTDKGTAALLEEVVKKFNLPDTLPDVQKDELLGAIRLDKKNINDTMNIILIKNIGHSFIKKINASAVEKYI